MRYDKTVPKKDNTTQQAGSPTSPQVMEFLQSHPGESFSPKQIGDALGLVPGRVSASLQYLNRQYDEIVKTGRGLWCWSPGIPEEGQQRRQVSKTPVELLAPLAEALEGRKGGTAGMVDAATKAPTLFEAVTTHRSGATVLRDSNGDLWLAQPIRIEVWPTLMALGITTESDQESTTRNNN